MTHPRSAWLWVFPLVGILLVGPTLGARALRGFEQRSVTAPVRLVVDPGADAAPATEPVDPRARQGDGRPAVASHRFDVRSASGDHHRYRILPPHGDVLLGDWSCDGTATPAVHLPAKALLAVFEAWPEPGGPPAAPTLMDVGVTGGLAHVEAEGACERVVVVP